MVRPSRSKELIPGILKEGPLTGIELYKKCRAKIGQLSEESYNEALHTLLKDEIINIEGYDPSKDTSRKRKQSFKSDGLIFYLIKNEQVDNFLLIKNLDDPEKGRECYDKLKKLFYKKMQTMPILYSERWENIISKVEKRPLTDSEILYLEAGDMVKGETGSDTTVITDDRRLNELAKSKINTLQTDIGELRLKYQDSIIFIIKNPSIFGSDTLNDEDPTPISLKDTCYLLADDSVSEEDFLIKCGYNKTDPVETSKIYEIFDNVISYINSKETGKAALIQRLSIGLSNKKESLNVLDELIEESYYMEHGES